jgi:hypothetical protein
MSDFNNTKSDQGGKWVFSKSIRRNGRVIYRKNGGVFRFWVKD